MIMGKKFGEINPSSEDRLRIDEAVDMMPFPKKKWVQVRFLDLDILPIKQHWISILTSKQKKEVNIPKFCVSFDPSTEGDIDGVTCPYCELGSSSIKDQKYYLANALIRDLQDDEPAKKTPITVSERDSGYKDMSSNSWTPVRVVRLPMSLAKKIKDLGSLNKVKTKSGEVMYYDVSHPSFGADVNVKFDPDEQGASMYSVQLASRTKLTPEEKAYLVYDLSDDLLDRCGRETSAEARKELDRMDLIDPPEQEQSSSRKQDTTKSKVKPKPEAPTGKSKPKVHQVEEDEDEDDESTDGGDYDVEEEETEAVSYDDEDDEDEDDAGDDEEEEEAPPAKRPARRGETKPVAKKPAAKTTGRSSSRTKKIANDDLEDDDIPF
jgi:hypothetical protein